MDFFFPDKRIIWTFHGFHFFNELTKKIRFQPNSILQMPRVHRRHSIELKFYCFSKKSVVVFCHSSFFFSRKFTIYLSWQRSIRLHLVSSLLVVNNFVNAFVFVQLCFINFRKPLISHKSVDAKYCLLYCLSFQSFNLE